MKAPGTEWKLMVVREQYWALETRRIGGTRITLKKLHFTLRSTSSVFIYISIKLPVMQIELIVTLRLNWFMWHNTESDNRAYHARKFMISFDKGTITSWICRIVCKPRELCFRLKTVTKSTSKWTPYMFLPYETAKHNETMKTSPSCKMLCSDDINRKIET